MKLIIDINLDNAAFEGDRIGDAIAWSLKDVAERFEENSRRYLIGNGNRKYIKDENGNTVGFATIEDTEETEEE